MPVEVVLLADTGLQGLEVGVGALHRPTRSTVQSVRAIGDLGSCQGPAPRELLLSCSCPFLAGPLPHYLPPMTRVTS
jgi:hypothetical protein